MYNIVQQVGVLTTEDFIPRLPDQTARPDRTAQQAAVQPSYRAPPVASRPAQTREILQGRAP